ncbi:MAG: CcmD family protein [Chitinophagales bacterium]|nr:CcmD family protein [Chitinophagales bacterium]
MNILSILTVLLLEASNTSSVGAESWMYGGEKFYVVFVVILIIFFGIFTFLILLERKLSKIEHQIKER